MSEKKCYIFSAKQELKFSVWADSELEALDDCANKHPLDEVDLSHHTFTVLREANSEDMKDIDAYDESNNYVGLAIG